MEHRKLEKVLKLPKIEKEHDKIKRPLIAAKVRGPGPGAYALPSTVGFLRHDGTKPMNPAYSLGRRLYDNIFKKDCSPGPAHKIDPRICRNGVDGTPSYSIAQKREIVKAFLTPAPGTYSPEKAHPQGEKHAPRYTFGHNTRGQDEDCNPAPNNYRLPPVLGSSQPDKQASPAYSLVSRRTVGCYLEDLAKAPGPGRYKTSELDHTMFKAPYYSMRKQCAVKSLEKAMPVPGPGAYYPERVVINKQIPPKFSLGIRHSEYLFPLIVECA